MNSNKPIRRPIGDREVAQDLLWLIDFGRQLHAECAAEADVIETDVNTFNPAADAA